MGIEQPRSTSSKNGAPFMAYGGDFGDHPNNGPYCMDGIVDSNPNITPGAEVFKKVLNRF